MDKETFDCVLGEGLAMKRLRAAATMNYTRDDRYHSPSVWVSFALGILAE